MALARKLLAIPATSAPAERLFSAAGHTLSSDRSRLTPDIAEAQEEVGIYRGNIIFHHICDVYICLYHTILRYNAHLIFFLIFHLIGPGSAERSESSDRSSSDRSISPPVLNPKFFFKKL